MIKVLDGADKIFGLEGDDVICGGGGNDQINGGPSGISVTAVASILPQPARSGSTFHKSKANAANLWVAPSTPPLVSVRPPIRSMTMQAGCSAKDHYVGLSMVEMQDVSIMCS